MKKAGSNTSEDLVMLVDAVLERISLLMRRARRGELRWEDSVCAAERLTTIVSGLDQLMTLAPQEAWRRLAIRAVRAADLTITDWFEWQFERLGHDLYAIAAHQHEARRSRHMSSEPSVAPPPARKTAMGISVPSTADDSREGREEVRRSLRRLLYRALAHIGEQEQQVPDSDQTQAIAVAMSTVPSVLRSEDDEELEHLLFRLCSIAVNHEQPWLLRHIQELAERHSRAGTAEQGDEEQET